MRGRREPNIANGDTTEPSGATPATGSMDSRMMWVMMIGCCLAIPLALIVGGVTAGGFVGVSPWLLCVGALLAVALVIVHRISSGPRCDTPPERNG